MRKRISITIRQDLLRQLDSTIDNVRVRNRSHAVESLLEANFSPAPAGVFILTGDRVSMALLAGKPLLERILLLLKNQKFDRALLGTTAETNRQIRAHFGDGSKFGIKLEYLEQKERVGTAATLRKAKSRFTDNFLFIYGDNFFDFDLRELVNFHRQTGFTATMALKTAKTPTRFGVVELQGRQVIGFNEKPSEAESYLVSAGVFVFGPKIFSAIPEGAHSLEKDVFPGLISTNRLAGCVVSGRWVPLEGEKDAAEIGRELFGE